MIYRRNLWVLFVFAFYFLSLPAGWAATDSLQWKDRATKIATDLSLSDSLKVIRISDLSYNSFYYYRSFDETHIDDFFRIVQPFVHDSDDLLAYIYGTAIIMVRSDSLRQKTIDQCVYYTERCHSHVIAVQNWERLARKHITHVDGLNFLFRGLKTVEGLSDYACESVLYRYLTLYYSLQGDRKNEMKYASLSLETALRTDNARTIIKGWECMAETYSVREEYQAAIDAYNEARKIYLELFESEEDEEERFIDDANYMIMSVNLGTMYYHTGRLDNASMLMYEALRTAIRINMVETQAYAHKELGRIYLELKQYDKSETHFLETEKLLAGDYISTAESNYIDYEVKLALANLYDIIGQYRKSADYYRAGIEKYRVLNDEEQLAQNQQQAAFYESKKQEEDITRRETIVDYHERQIYIYACILIVILISLFFAARMFHIRIKLALRAEKALHDKAQLLEIENRNTEMDSELKQKESESLKQKLLLGNSLREQHNNTLEALTGFFNRHPELSEYSPQVKSIMLQQTRIDNNVDEFRLGVNTVPLDFYVRLQKIAGNKLSSLDLKYCRLLYLDTSTRAIAELLSVEPKTVRMQKYRLKQKLNLDKEDDLHLFIRQITEDKNGTA